MRVGLAAACFCSALAWAAPVPKEIKNKPSSLAGTWKILESQRFGAKPSTADAYWTMDEKGNSWFHSTEKPPIDTPPSDVNAADFARKEMNYRTPASKENEYSMHGVFAFEGDVLVINYNFDKNGPEMRPKGLELETGGMRWKLKKVAEYRK